MTRSWWGWGATESALTSEETAGLATLVEARFGNTVSPIDAPDPASVDVLDPRITVPDALAGLRIEGRSERLRHGHGQSFREVARAARGRIDEVPDAVLAPRSAGDVAAVLDWASDSGVALVPFGGGTSVVGGVSPREREPWVSLDTSRLGSVLEIDEVSRMAHLGAGLFGPQVEEALRPHGLTLRHFPQSWEFSTVGGWIATRAGGHYATGWTHIDDFVAAIGAETPSGRWDSRRLPGSGAGPSPDRTMIGSEGALGVITDAWLRVVPRATFRAKCNAVFADFRAGAGAVRALAQSGLQPANCRLLDPVEAALAGAGDGSRAVLVLGFESADHPVGPWLERAIELVRDHDGTVDGGPTITDGDVTGVDDGAAAQWRQTFLRAPYLRDALVRLGMVVETFETAITWDRFDGFVTTVENAVREAVVSLCGAGSVSVRLTHAYPDGAAPYWTVIAPAGASDPVALWDEIKSVASDALIEAGGTITHHHAVGRDHVPWYRQQVPAPFHAALEATRNSLDPAGICNPGVLGLGVAG